MARTAGVVCLGAALALAAIGCTHLVESRTISKFAEAIENKDAAALKAASTGEFKQKALRHAQALDDLEILSLPDGKISVAKVVEKSPTEKEVYVHVGDKKRKLLYFLRKDGTSKEWKISDIQVPQQRSGLVESRTVTEQMDLLLTVREFLESWEGGSRSAILETATPELAGVLGELPPQSLARLAKQVVGEHDAKAEHRPKATLDNKVAVVSLPRKTGRMLLKMQQDKDDKWKVADVAAESHADDNHLNSLLKKAVVMRTAERFLAAYAAGDKPALQKLCNSQLYRECLENAADLTEFPLVPGQAGETSFEITQANGRANFVLKGPKRWTRITLVELREQRAADAPTEFVVEDAAVYHAESRQEVRISSFFVSRAKVQLFASALSAGNITYLKKLSSPNFNNLVWDKAEPELLAEIRDLGLTADRVRIDATDHHGAVTEIHARQGDVDVTYVLRDRDGIVGVDDVQVLKYGQPQSLKSTMELALPIRKFSQAVREGDVASLQRHSSRDFNRLIWKQTRIVPSTGHVVPRYLDHPITSVQRTGDDVIITLGDDRQGAKVLLVNEFSQFVIDDVILVAGQQPDQQARLKQRMRLQLAETGARHTGTAVRTAEHSQDASRQDGGVEHAAHRVDAPADDELTKSIAVDPANSAFQDAPATGAPAEPGRLDQLPADSGDEPFVPAAPIR